jgi:hypothetical protein
MKTRYKIPIMASISIFALYMVLASYTTCILTTEPYDWLGSHNGCGPAITLELQRFFENLLT